MSTLEIYVPDYPSTSELARAALPALARREVYQRAAELVHVVREPRVVNGVTAPVGTPRIRTLPKTLLRNELADSCDWTDVGRQDDRESIEPPPNVVTTILEAGEWGHVRELRGIAHWPVVTSGGIAMANGYDTSSSYLLCDLPTLEGLPEHASSEDARLAVAELLELISEFPIESEAGRAVWLALVLTLLARPAIKGPVPAFLFEASTPGTGKTLLANAAHAVVTGETPPVKAAPSDGAEWSRTLVSIARDAAPMVLLDNLRGKVESGAFEALLTSAKFSDRKLRSNEIVSFDVLTVFALTANNANLTVDLTRRCLGCRLNAESERPELKGGFKINRLLSHIEHHRPRLLRAALMILHAYRCAGSPPVEMRPMGSFEEWSDVVRAPLLWAGCADPGETQDGLRDAAADELDSMGALLEAWHSAFGDRPTTVKEALFELGTEGAYPALRDALEAACGVGFAELTARGIGALLKANKGRIFNGHRLAEGVGSRRDGVRWCVTLVNHQSHEGPEKAAA